MKKTFALCVLSFLILVTGGCGKDQPSPAKEEQRLKTYKVSTSEITTCIEATGSVQPDLEGTSRILPYLSGTVYRILVKPGDRVKKGEALISISCPEVTDTYSSYLGALAQLSQAERIYNLNTQLFEVGAVTKNDVLNSEAMKRQLAAVVDGLKNKLRMYGYSTEGEAALKKPASNTVVINAPMNGYVADVQTHVGDKVDVSTPLMTIADPNNIVIVANIYDTDSPRVKKGRSVNFTVDTFPDTAFKGTITYVSDVSDMDSKTVKTFITISDRKDLFKQNMFLKLKIEDRKRVLPMIPQSAMLYKDGKFFVYYASGMGTQTLREIRPVQEAPGKFMAVEGIEEGEEIILTAIDLEKR